MKSKGREELHRIEVFDATLKLTQMRLSELRKSEFNNALYTDLKDSALGYMLKNIEVLIPKYISYKI